MSHLFMIREAVSFVEAPGAMYGVDERLERAIDKWQCEFEGGRKGYNTPQCTEFKFKSYRMKKECMSRLLAKLQHVISLNPKTIPKSTYYAVLPRFVRRFFVSDEEFKKLIANNHYASIGTAIQIVQICMHWFCKIPFCPLKSIDAPTNAEIEKETRFITGAWHYNYVIGYINDLDRGFGEEL